MMMNTKTYDSRSLSILAKSLYKELRSGGCEKGDVLSLASELIGIVTDDVARVADESEEE